MMPIEAQPTVEQLADGVIREWIDNQRIFVVRLNDTEPSNIDVYIDSHIMLVKNWPQGKVYANIQDISNPKVSLTPYFRKRLGDLERTFKEVNRDGYSAVVLPNTFMFRIFAAFGKYFTARINTGLDMRYFNKYDDALNWIKSQIK